MKKYLPHLKKYLPHLAFIIAMLFLMAVLEAIIKGYVIGDTAFQFVTFVTIIFFLWKNNYFKRNN